MPASLALRYAHSRFAGIINMERKSGLFITHLRARAQQVRRQLNEGVRARLAQHLVKTNTCNVTTTAQHGAEYNRCATIIITSII